MKFIGIRNFDKTFDGTLKSFCNANKITSQWDIRQKWWEISIPTNRATQKRLKLIKDFIELFGGVWEHDWDVKNPNYRDSVYSVWRKQ